MSQNTKFRTLSSVERAEVRTLIERSRTSLSENRSRTLQVRFDAHDNFTIAVIKIGKSILTGVAKRNPRDKANRDAGQAVALRRAIVSNFPPPEPEDEDEEFESGLEG